MMRFEPGPQSVRSPQVEINHLMNNGPGEADAALMAAAKAADAAEPEEG
jgi:hypothetical protein